MMPAAVLDNIVPVSDFSRGKAAAAFAKVATGAPVIVVKNNRPTAVVLTPEEYAYLAEIEEDMALYNMAMERLARLEADPNPKYYTEEEIMEEFGITEEDLEAVDDAELELE